MITFTLTEDQAAKVISSVIVALVKSDTRWRASGTIKDEAELEGLIALRKLLINQMNSQE